MRVRARMILRTGSRCVTFSRVTRTCACGCGTSIEGSRPNAIYASDACKSRAWRRKSGYRLRAHRKQGQTPKKRDGVTVYLASAEVAQAVLTRLESHPGVFTEESGAGRDALVRAIERKRRRA